MSYSICGLIVPEREAAVCDEMKWPWVKLAEGVGLIPLARDYLLLVEGDQTEARDHLDLVFPEWLRGMLSRLTTAAYIEAEFFGGAGMQAAEISSGAINAALRRFGVSDGPAGVLYGVPLAPGKDPFDMVRLGRHRSVEGWLKKAREAEK
jgi:hypothetical protein